MYYKEIVYPVFIDISVHVDDGFWKSVIVDLAYGMCPKGTYINKESICCYKNKTKILHNIESYTLKADDVVAFLKENTSLRSQKEKMRVFEYLKSYNNQLDFQTWAAIKKKSLKDILIERYILSIRRRFNMSYKKAIRVKSEILLAIAFKHVKPSDIILEDGEISEINGVEFDDCGNLSVI